MLPSQQLPAVDTIYCTKIFQIRLCDGIYVPCTNENSSSQQHDSKNIYDLMD